MLKKKQMKQYFLYFIVSHHPAGTTCLNVLAHYVVKYLPAIFVNI